MKTSPTTYLLYYVFILYFVRKVKNKFQNLIEYINTIVESITRKSSSNVFNFTLKSRIDKF